ncbi:MAG: rhamnan synthesis F family protein [Arcobacter sp.]|uniref:rhamnan synthesis F family protein n=1 Tax=Arcobacter sp. TaxID=1872629 RepID=UPI003AFFBC86
MSAKKIKLTNEERESILYSKTCRIDNDFSKLCLFSHFDAEHIIDEYVIFCIQKLFELEFDIVFVTTSEKIGFEELSKISKYLKKIVIKKNVGYDFISWKIGLSEVDYYTKYKMILHINDSIFFPLTNPLGMFETMKKKSVDFWGICDSFTFKHHIESFFWVFNEKIIKSVFYNKFWNECKKIENKIDLIKTYEVEFTSLVKKNNFTISSYISMQELLDYAALNFNEYDYTGLYQSTPFHSFWEIIIEHFKAPFIKKNILCYGHKDYNIGTQYWEECINKFTDYNKILISNNIERFVKTLNDNNSINFYKNLNTFLYTTESLKHKKKFIIYGYGVVGQFVHSVLKENVVGIIDSNFNKVNEFQKRYGLSVDIVHPDLIDNIDFDEIILCAFGREKEIQKELNNKKIYDSRIINPSLHIEGSSLKFSNNITSFARTLKYIHFLNLKKYAKISLYNSSSIILKYCNEYMKQNNLNPVENYTVTKTIKRNRLSFFIESKAMKNSTTIPFYVN